MGNKERKVNTKMYMQENKNENASNLPPLLTVKQTAELLQCAERTVARMCERGDIKAVKVRSLWRINRDALFSFAGITKGEK